MAIVDRSLTSGFIETDVRAIEEMASVEHLVYTRWFEPRWFTRVARSVMRNDAVYFFFASEHALLPAILFRLLARRVILVPAGYDAANVPEHGYGFAANGRGWLTRAIAFCATAILPISDAAKGEMLALVPSAESKTRRVYLAPDPANWSDPEVIRDRTRVVTVAAMDPVQWSRKGIDRFLELARSRPECDFVVVGEISRSVASLAASAPANVRFTGFLEHEELRRLLWSSGVYVQLSWHESFGFAMAEAMLCGCVPVISVVPALREVAGDWAYVSLDRSTDSAVLEEAIDADLDRRAMRNDVKRRCNLPWRKRALALACGG